MSSSSSLFSNWRQDLPASLVVFLVAVPLCLGIALASGAPLISGLIAGIVGGIVVGAISGSQLGVSGPAAGLAAIVLVAIQQLGSFPLFLTAVVLAGLIQVILGFVRAGVIAYFFPNSVIKGMLAGIGVIIILKQLPHAVGDDKDWMGDETFDQMDKLNTFEELWFALQNPTLGAIVITLACLALMILWERPFVKRIKALAFVPGPLVAVVLGTVLAKLFQGHPSLAISSDHLVRLPDLSAGLSTVLTFPDPAGLTNSAVWTIALTLAIVASIETLLCVEATDKLDPEKRITPTNLELKAQGVGNVLSGLVGGLPITQVIVRSSANIQSGGRTKLSAIVHGAMILLSLLLIPGMMNMIPLASLAAILLMTGYKLAKPSLFKTMYAQGWYIFIPFIATVLGVVLIDLLKGVMLGMCVGIFFVLRNSYL
ncbi:MAG: SulP family inorganic anion transporter, partial [Flavobacteriales bacterium]|nr:SulP family inorganic anion transporter [Flavobacteriales bacterium]